jgi:hypothetical protein
VVLMEKIDPTFNVAQKVHEAATGDLGKKE